MKKILALALVLSMVVGLVAVSAVAEGIPASEIKVGYILVGDENDAFSNGHVIAVDEMKAALGLTDAQIIYKKNIPETEECYYAAIDLAEQGCDIIFGNSYSFGDYMLQAAEEYPDIQFCHATGDKAASCGLSNFHNFFGKIHEARFVAGVAAGMKLNQMIEDGKITAEEAKIGYVGAKPFAEVISGFTAFYLGARYVCPSVTMEVKYTGEWNDLALEKEATDALIADKCVLLSQHSDSTGPSTACEAAGVAFVGYNASMIATAPTQALVSSGVNWGPYVTMAVKAMIDGDPIPVDWCEGFAGEGVHILGLNDAAVAPGTADKLAEVEAMLRDGSLQVFDIETFTVGGAKLESFNTAYGMDGVELVSDGYFHEGEYRSAPCFESIIDGITII